MELKLHLYSITWVTSILKPDGPGTLLEPGTCNLEPGSWNLELIASSLELGTWSLERGAFNLELGTWKLEHLDLHTPTFDAKV